MAALSVISIWMMSLYYLHWTAYCRLLPIRIEDEDFEAVCSRKCHPSAEEPFDLPQYQCSCSQSCTVYDDCCLDSPFRNTRESLEHAFVCLSVVKRGKFLAVLSCPPHQRSDTCRDSLGHLSPVTSTTTNITYGNIFCASCNGDGDDLITWNVQLRCHSDGEDEDDLASSVVYDADGFWKLDEVEGTRRSCRYHEDEDWVLEGLELRPCDGREMVSSCSPSWKDLELIEKCRSYEDPVYFGDTAYRNVHCAQCNYLTPEYSDCIPSYLRDALQMQLHHPRLFEYCRRRDCLTELGRGEGSTLSNHFGARDCPPGEKPHPKTGKCRKVRTG